MPELPEVETVRRGLAPVMEGARILNVTLRRENLRYPFPENFAARLTGWRIERLRRRAKYLVAELTSGESLVMHLGMSGRFQTGQAKGPGGFYHQIPGNTAHDHVEFSLETADGREASVTYNDPRRFGFMALEETGELDQSPHFAGLGPEPLDPAFTPESLGAALKGRSVAVKQALLDQHVVAGLGNIYVCEALYRAGISPRRKASTIAGKRAARLVPEIRDVLAEAIEAGGSTLRDHARPDGNLGYFQHDFRVYDREGDPCPACQQSIRRLVQAGRSTFYCTRCQR